jgi:homocysteine S-methyltransferase
MSRFTPLIEDGRVHVLDGAMGTFLYSRGVFVNVCYDELNLSQPDLVRDVHERYIRVGAEAVETNTFGANPVKLSSWSLDDRTEDVNRTGAEIARAAAQDRAAVLGAVGPLGIRIEPWGPTSRDEAVSYFARQITGLVDGGVDAVILETFGDLDELHTALIAARRVTDLPVIAQVTISEEGETAYGSDPEKVARSLTEWGADVIGVNCSVGPAIMLEAVERMTAVTDRPLVAQPNAGMPRVVGDRKIYLSSPEYMATYAMRMMEAGARFVGGCCGTTPDHIHAMRLAMRQRRPRPSGEVVRPREADEGKGVDPVALDRRSRWGAKLARREWVTSVELLPPKGASAGRLIEQAQRIKVAGADVVSILDGARAQSHMGVIPSALVVERQVGIETVAHYTCRDRNMLGMISDLVGAAAAGLRNVLIVTGDPPRTGPYGDATAVFDIDSIGLTNVVDRLNHGLDPGGNPIGDPTQWVIGVAANHAAANMDAELHRLHWKVDAGADFVVTQPVFDPARLAEFLEAAHLTIPVVAGIWPLASLRNAEFLANEMPGVTIPPAVLERMAAAQKNGDDAAAAEGVAIAREMRDTVRTLVQGIHVSVPFGNVELAVEVLQG